MTTHLTSTPEPTAPLNSSRDVNPEALATARARLLQSAQVLDLLTANFQKERQHIAQLRRAMNCDPPPEQDDPIAVLARQCREAADGLKEDGQHDG